MDNFLTNCRIDYKTMNDGNKIAYRTWETVQNCKGVVYIIHGNGAHSGRYGGNIVKQFHENGYTAIGIDLRGHGLTYYKNKSTKKIRSFKTLSKKNVIKKGHAPSVDVLIKDIDEIINDVKKDYADVPHYLCGHSMGGNIALNYILKYNTSSKITGVVVSSPWLKLERKLSLVEKALSTFGEKVYPSFTKRVGKAKYNLINDPLSHNMISIGLFNSIKKSGIYIIQNADKIKTPIHLIHGKGDKITSCKASEEFYSKLKCSKSKQILNTNFHSIDDSEVIKKAITWADSITKKSQVFVEKSII